MRWFVELAYDGSGYSGWQVQPNAPSVQAELERALGTVLRQPTPITGAGRTDAGVHARTMYAHFDTPGAIENPEMLVRGLNRLCGKGVTVKRLVPVHPEAHARFDATGRTYKYFVTLEESPFLRNAAWHSPSRLDTGGMNEAAALLLETDDFTSFAKLHSDAKTNICRVTQAVWTPWENTFGTPGLVFTISADRFLRNMVRAVVGTLVDVGRGKLSPDDFAAVVARKDRCAAGTSMPPQALFLWDITYDYIDADGYKRKD